MWILRRNQFHIIYICEKCVQSEFCKPRTEKGADYFFWHTTMMTMKSLCWIQKLSARQKVADMFWFDAPKAVILKNKSQIFKTTHNSLSRHLPQKISCQSLMFKSFNFWFRMFKFSVVCARFFVRSFTYSEVFRPEDQNSFGSEAVSWRCLSMTIGGGVGGGDLLWGICALPGVPDLQVLLEPQLVAEDIYNICLKFKEVRTDLK